MLLNPFTFHSPKSLEETLKLYSKLENVKLQAGGTFLLNALKLMKRKGAKTPENVISLRNVKELQGIESNPNSLTIKAMTVIDDLFESAELTDNFAILKTVCRNISTQPIRSMATVGGNLTCRYTWTEMPATMIGLEAKMHFQSTDGKEEVLPAAEFYKNQAKTDKIFTHLEIPREKDVRIAYRRVKKTQNVDIPLLSLMIKTNIKDNKWSDTVVAVNNCVAFAQRDQQLEKFLNGCPSSPSLAQEALDHLSETIYDTRSSDYKKHMFRVSIRNAINEICENN